MLTSDESVDFPEVNSVSLAGIDMTDYTTSRPPGNMGMLPPVLTVSKVNSDSKVDLSTSTSLSQPALSWMVGAVAAVGIVVMAVYRYRS